MGDVPVELDELPWLAQGRTRLQSLEPRHAPESESRSQDLPSSIERDTVARQVGGAITYTVYVYVIWCVRMLSEFFCAIDREATG